MEAGDFRWIDQSLHVKWLEIKDMVVAFLDDGLKAAEMLRDRYGFHPPKAIKEDQDYKSAMTKWNLCFNLIDRPDFETVVENGEMTPQKRERQIKYYTKRFEQFKEMNGVGFKILA